MSPEVLLAGSHQTLEILVEASYLYDFPIAQTLSAKPDVVSLLRWSLLADIAALKQLTWEAPPTVIMKHKNTLLLEITGKGEL